MNLTSQSEESEVYKASFKRMLRDRSPHWAINVSRHEQVYASGEVDDHVYLINTGRIKLLLPVPEGDGTLVDIFSEGDLFGESCLSGRTTRLETAVAMEESTLLKIPSDEFMAALGRDSLLISMARYLAARFADHQEKIVSLLSADNI